MAALTTLLEQDRFPTVVSDTTDVVNQAVSQQSGITGMAIKGTLAAAKKVDSDIVSKGLCRVLPDIIRDLASDWEDFEAANTPNFGEFLAQREDKITDKILATADKHAQSNDNGALIKAYGSIRGKGAKLIAPHIPELGHVLQKHM